MFYRNFKEKEPLSPQSHTSRLTNLMFHQNRKAKEPPNLQLALLGDGQRRSDGASVAGAADGLAHAAALAGRTTAAAGPSDGVGLKVDRLSLHLFIVLRLWLIEDSLLPLSILWRELSVLLRTEHPVNQSINIYISNP